MTNLNIKTLLGSTALILVTTSTAIADVTAKEVWENWKGYIEASGQHVSVGSENYSVGTLTLRDVTMSMAFPEGKFSGSLDMIEMKERGDGTVAITLPADYPMSVSIHPEDGEDVDLAMIFRQTGTTIVASGEGDSVSYDYLASNFSMKVDNLIVDGIDVNPDIRLDVKNLDGGYTIDSSKGTAIDSATQVGKIDFHFSMSEPGGDGSFNMDGSVENLSSRSQSLLPGPMDANDPSWVFTSGFLMSADVETGASNYDFSFNDGSDSFSAKGGAATSGFEVAIVEGSISYATATTDLKYDIKSNQIPFPITFAADVADFEFVMPMKKSDAPSDYAFVTKLVDFTINNEVWGMLDPGGVLPRDPATFIIDITGKMNWLIDIADPKSVETFTGQNPGELYALTLNEMKLAAAGAEINGEGDFTFDNSDLVTFQGMPAPTGEINMNIIGANGLLDRLIKMGILPQEQAMGARMMLGLFARAGAGDDALTSKIEVKGNGSVFANGQQIK